MILISQNVVLSPPAAPFSLNNPLFGYRSYVSGVTADTEDPDHPASNLLNNLTYSYWQASDTSAQNLTFALTSVDASNYIGLARHNFGSAAIAFSVEAYIDGNWVEIYPANMPANDSPLIIRVEEQSFSQVRLVLAEGDAPARIAIAKIGPALIAQRRIWLGHTPITMGVTTEVVSGMSERGEFGERIVLGEYNSTTIDLKNLTPDWYREYFDPFVVAAKTGPFFFAWRPVDYPLEVGLCWLTNNPRPSNSRRRTSSTGQDHGLMSVQLAVNGIV